MAAHCRSGREWRGRPHHPLSREGACESQYDRLGAMVDDEALVRIRLRSGDGPEREAEREAVARSLVVISQNAAVARIVFIKADEDKGRTLGRIESGIAAMQLAIRAASREVNRGAVEELPTFLAE